MKKLFTMLAMVLVLSLCACGDKNTDDTTSKANHGEASGKKDTASTKEDDLDAGEIVQRYVQNNPTNYHNEISMEYSISADADGVSINVPLTYALSVDILDSHVHGTMTLHSSFMGTEIFNEAEVYITEEDNKLISYMYDAEDGYWERSETDDSVNFITELSAMDSTGFKNADVSYDRKSGAYTITQPFKDFMKTSTAAGMIDDLSKEMTDTFNVDTDDVYDKWNDAVVTYVFDEDFYLLSVTIDECAYEDTVEDDGMSIAVNMTFSMSFEFSDYDKIRKSDVEVPDDVIEAAIGSVSIYIPDTDWDDDGGSPDIIYEIPENVGDDYLGAYNGVSFNTAGTSWSDTFGSDGWDFDNEDGEYNFMTAINPKYEDVDVYVFNRDMHNTTRSDILEKGVYSYEVDAYWSSGNLPNVTWNGLTFGATADELVAAYGEPKFYYNYEEYARYTFEISREIELEFTVSHELGLRSGKLVLFYY